MADMNLGIIQGTISNFDKAVVSGNLDDEKRAWCRVNVSQQTSRKNESGKYIYNNFMLTAFGRQAINLAKLATPGKGFVFSYYLIPSKPRMENGQQILDSAGKKIYDGIQLGISSFHFQNNYEQGSRNNSSTQAADSIAVDPMADFAQEQKTTANTNSPVDFMADFPFA